MAAGSLDTVARNRRRLGAGLVLLVAVQAAIWLEMRRVYPPYVALPDPPGLTSSALEALGDEQFLFRVRALELQHAGSLDGHMLPYRDLDYAKLVKWLALFDQLDPKADIGPAMAAYLFSNSQNPEDCRPIVAYLQQHALRDPPHKWRWLAQAVFIARWRLKDNQVALEAARQLAALDVPDLPAWARQMPVFVLVDMGERQAARQILEGLLHDDPNLPDNERRWIAQYVQRHLI